MRHIKHFLKPSLFQLIYHVTYVCNAHCPFCLVHNSHRNAKDDNELNLEQIDKIASHLHAFPWLILTGGEPFIRQDLCAIVNIFSRRCKISHVTVTTNGMFPDRACAFIKELFQTRPDVTINMAFSIDGIGEKHDYIRATLNNYRLLTQTIARMKELRKLYPNLSLKAHTVLSQQNFQQFEQIIEEIRKLGLDMHTFDFVRSTKDNKGHDLHELAIDEIRKLIPLIQANNHKYMGYENLKLHSKLVKGIAMAVLNHNYTLYPEFMTKKTQAIPCQAAERNLVIDAYGNLGFCELRDWIGNLRDYDYDAKKLLVTEGAQKLKQSIYNKECHCFHPCYQLVNVLFNKKELAKAVLSNILHQGLPPNA